jgi:TRAP-type C4-dicarboxylate transport system permease large subunit
MYNLYNIPEASTELGWDVGLPLILALVLFALAVPIWVALGFAAVGLLVLTEVLPLTLFGEALFSGIDTFALIAIPLFILTGDVLVRSGLSGKLLDVAEATMGSLRSGFGTSTVLGCGFFSCISGSDAAGAAAVGRITYSRLVEVGYPKPYACALVASGACTGILIPPSIAYIIIGLVLGISASTLFLAAAVPGVMIMVSIMLTNVVLNRARGYEHSDNRFNFRTWLHAVWDGKFALMIPVIILGGIYSGIFTPTEAAAVIIAFALPLAQTLAALEVPQTFVQAITAATDNQVLIVLMMLGVFIVAGCVMETTPNIVILSPIMLPLAQEIGMNEIHFCIFMVTSLGVGFITPPLGLNLFVLSGLTGESVLAIARQAVPYVGSMLIVVLLLAFVPALSTWAL